MASPLEIVGAGGAIAALSQQCLQLFTRIQEALKYAQGMAAHLLSIGADVENVDCIVRYIHDQVILHVPEIKNPLDEIRLAAQELSAYVDELVQHTRQGSGLRRFSRGLLQGPSEHLHLNRLKENLLQAKTTLIISIQLSTIGFVKKRNATVVNLIIVSTVDRWLNGLPGNDQGGLKITEYLRDKGVQQDQEYFEPSLQDLEELLGPLQEPDTVDRLAAMPRDEIIDNETTGFAVMFNSTVGDGTSNVHAVEKSTRPVTIRGNRAGGVSFMTNRPISKHQAGEILDRQESRLDQFIKAGLIGKVNVMSEIDDK